MNGSEHRSVSIDGAVSDSVDGLVGESMGAVGGSTE